MTQRVHCSVHSSARTVDYLKVVVSRMQQMCVLCMAPAMCKVCATRGGVDSCDVRSFSVMAKASSVAAGAQDAASECSESEASIDWELCTHETGQARPPSPCLGGVFLVGALPINSYEEDLQYDYFRRGIYLVRGVSFEGLCVPGICSCEALAFGMISSGQATWDQLFCACLKCYTGGRTGTMEAG